MLDDPSIKFRLQITGFQMKAIVFDPTSQQRIIKDLGIKVPSLVNFVWDESVDDETRGRPLLKQALRSQAKELEVKEPVPQEEAKPVPAPKAEEPKKKASLTREERENKMLKMLGFGKKK